MGFQESPVSETPKQYRQKCEAQYRNSVLLFPVTVLCRNLYDIYRLAVLAPCFLFASVTLIKWMTRSTDKVPPLGTRSTTLTPWPLPPFELKGVPTSFPLCTTLWVRGYPRVSGVGSNSCYRVSSCTLRFPGSGLIYTLHSPFSSSNSNLSFVFMFYVPPTTFWVQ